ncbi:hypothetical protein E0Z10_g4175 [Xylaria hypoxylon]|uniref:Uncharacterized protein n=1 Tax=Xylaria hypoxylon TaxID=37992 RepID=A0A4Z0YZG4_9PEZI|nr:hypothetical protein E0Z10_g4175 [Xylaria hypoxylon]
MSSRKQTMENSSNGPPTIPRRSTSRNATTGNQPSQSSSNVATSAQGEPSQRPNMTINTNINWQSQHEVKAKAPWARPEDFTPRGSGFTPSSAAQQQLFGSSGLPSPSGLSRSNARKVKRDSFRSPQIQPRETSIPTNSPLPSLPQHPQAIILDSLDRLPREPRVLSPYFRGSNKSSQENPTTPVKGMVRGITGLKEKVLKKAGFNSTNVDPPRYRLTANQYGQIQLLTLEHERYLEISEPSQSRPLIHARETLQAFRSAFTRDLPELQFPRGQAQVDIVAGYLMDSCPSRLEDSMTTELVRHSEASLRMWAAVLHPHDNPSISTQARRWNTIEARRRVRHQNRVIEEFNRSWDAWVAEQSNEIQAAARRDASGESIQDITRAPFGDFYHYMLIAADGEIRQQKDIAEALVLQYPDSFPGFMGNLLKSNGRSPIYS